MFKNSSPPSSSDQSLTTVYLNESSCLVFCKLFGYKEINFNVVHGDLRIKLLFGNLSINEYSLPRDQLIESYADKDHPLFCRTIFDPECTLSHFKAFFADHQLFDKHVRKEISRLNLLESGGCFMVLYAERNQDPLHLKYSYLVGRNVDSANWIKLAQGEQIELKEAWRDCLAENLESQLRNEQAKSSRIVMVCGGRNSGKSTLIRQLINRQLGGQQNRKIYYLDLDPGQSEFTNSGQISLVEIDKPILFPSFINVCKFRQQIVYSCSVTSTNMEDIGSLYSENLAHLWCKVQPLIGPNDLVLVNTMGFVRIIGFMMLVDAIKLIRPSHLIEIKFELPDQVRNLYDINYSAELTAKNIAATKGWLDFDSDRLKLRYSYLQLNHEYGLHSPKKGKLNRINSQLVYLSLIDDLLERPITHLKPRAVRFEDVKIYLAIENRPEDRLVLDILSCSWVQLCRIEEDDSSSSKNLTILKQFGPNRCLGNAFIRNVDIKNRLFYIITPESSQTIQQVNCFVKPNSLTVPKEIFIPQLVYSKVEPLYIDVKF